MIIECGEQDRKPSDFINILHGDVLLHANAFEDYSNGLPVTRWQDACLTTYNCNSLNSPNITDWESAVNGLPHFDFHVISPNSVSHVKLTTHTRALFRELDWERTRLFLAGEEGLKVANPQQPITANELDFYLDAAERQGVFSLKTRPSEVEFSPDVIDILLTLQKYDMQTGKNWDRFQAIEFDQRFRNKFLHANLYKLASYLAVMDHATFEAQAEGAPVPANYVPANRRSEELDNYYKKKYGKSYPSITEVYEYAYGLFVSKIGNTRDGVIDHIVEQVKLPYLV